MASIKTAYGANGQALTITLASLADSSTAGRESTSVSNTSDLWLDVLISAKFALSTGTVSDPKTVQVYAYASVDGGTEFPDAMTGTDGNRTMDSPTQLKLLGAVYFTAQSQSKKGGPWSLAALYGGRMPEKWGVFVLNDTGIALTGTAGDHAVKYQGVYTTAA